VSSEFLIYLRLGFHHIADLAGYDHILFVTALAIPYAARDWRRLLVLVTAFTVGHSVTLALATLRLVSVPSTLVEALIPATILVTAVLAWRETRTRTSLPDPPPADAPPTTVTVPASRYLLATLFGLIHGLGFSTYLRALLGEEESIALPLFAFNVGLELGQLLILAVVLTVGALVVRTLMDRRRWAQILVGVTATLSLFLLVQRI
jgi:HupE / UreJ protein